MSNAIAGGVLLSDVRPPEKLRSALLIGDRWIEETSAGQLSHVNPATGKAQCVFPVAGKIEVDGAVAAARSVFPQWSTTPPNVRRDLLLRLAELLREHTPEFAGIAGLETGQPIGQARGTLAAEWATYYAGWVDKLDGRVIPTLGNSGLDYTLSEPYGVIGVMVPFNGPLTIAAMTVFPALAAGNCVVLKPSELTPFSCVHLAELVLEAGIPPGVLNLVTGGGVVGDALVRHPGVDKISFTGGPVTARKIMAAAAENLTPLLLELGGKSANLLFADAELQAASQFSATFSMLGSGQGCALPTRLFVEASVYDQVVDSVVSIVSGLKVGMPFDPTTNLGPVISRESQERILGVVRRACDEEAGTLLFGGERLGGELAEGFFMSPAVFGDVDPASDLSQKEIFGPVLAISRFETEDEALAMANSTPWGLAGYVQTSNLARMQRLSQSLEAGYVSFNGFAGLTPGAPFGGIKGSGFGREGGLAGIEEFVRCKNVFIANRDS